MSQPKLREQSGFVALWLAHFASVMGSQVSALAVPLTAAVYLNATPTQMGVQTMLWTGGMVIAALFAGPWVDRGSRRRMMIVCDVIRAVVLLTVPAAAVAGVLTIEQLWTVSLLFSMLTAVFDVANYSLLPSIVGKDQLVAGNSVMEGTRSVLTVAGPGLAGPLIAVLTAPIALAVDALSYFISAVLLTRIRRPSLAPSTPRRSMWHEIGDGIAFVVRQPVLRSLALSSATFVFFLQFFFTLQVWYATQQLGLGPVAIGLIAAIGGLAGAIAAACTRGIVSRVGVSSTMMGGLLLSAFGGLMVPLSAGSTPAVLVILGIGAALNGAGTIWYNVNATSLRQAVTPNAILGRVNSTMRFLAMAAAPIAALLAGTAGEIFGVRTVLVVASTGQALATLPLLLSPTRQLKRLPKVEHDARDAVSDGE